MAMNQLDVRLVFGLWLAIMAFVVGAVIYFYFGTSDANTKRRALHWYLGIGGVLILLWFWIVGGLMMFLVGIPLWVIAALISLKTTYFCPSCGRALINQFIKARYCPRCGSELEPTGSNLAKDKIGS